MARLTEEQAELMARQVALQARIGNEEAIITIVKRAFAEADRSRIELLQSHDSPRTIPIAAIGLEERIVCTLERNGFLTVGDLLSVTAEKVRSLRQMGKVRGDRVTAAVKQLMAEHKNFDKMRG